MSQLLKDLQALHADVLETVEKYGRKPGKGQTEFTWKTIGGEMGADGKRHGGHPVAIDSKGVMQSGAFRGKTMGEAFGGKSNSPEKPDSSKPKPDGIKPHPKHANEKAQLLSDLENAEGMGGWDHARKIRAELDAKYPGWEEEQEAEMDREAEAMLKPKAPQPAIQPVTRPNESAKSGDQLGLFGQAAAPKRDKAPELAPGGESKGKQVSLFDTKGPADQQMLFATDDVTPADMVGGKKPEVYKPVVKPMDAQKKSDDDGPIAFRDRRAFADKMAADGKSHSDIVDAMTKRGVAASDARRHAAAALGDKAQGEGSFADKLPDGWKESQPGGMATGPNGEIVDKEIKSGKWFAIGDGPTLDGFGSRKEAMDALAKKQSEPKQPEAAKAEPPKATAPVKPPEPIDKPSTPTEQATSTRETAIAKGDTPRQAVAAAQKELDADYEFARSSSVRNAGEDLKGSARHKVNAWKNLDDAEKNGTAAELVTRDQLLKNEPHDLMIHADRNPLTSLAMHFAMRAFPGNPGTKSKGDHKKDREQYLEAYRSVKQKAEELAKTKDSGDVIPALREMQKHVEGLINKYRGVPAGGSAYMATDRYNQTANDLVGLYKAVHTGYSTGKNSVAGRLNEFSSLARERYGDTASSVENLAEHAKDIMEGHSLNKTFGKESKKSNRFDPTEVYVKVARRSGGRDMSKVTSDPNKATDHLVKEMGLRGVQWGNTVSDDERKHHAGKALEALVDLADVTGLHPKDIALDGKLGLAIGARGKGNASAHYEPGTQVINLTRSSGVGALAHEWGHAFDHMLNDYGFKTKTTRRGESREGGNYMSGDLDTHEIRATQVFPGRKQWTSTTSNPKNYEDQKSYTVHERPLSGIRSAYRKWWEASQAFRDRLQEKLNSDVKEGRLSAAKASDYWGSSHEIFARTFERHIQHKLESEGRENTYLSGLGGEHPYWPSKSEAKEMAGAFDGIMEAYRQHKHGSAEKVKFSRADAYEIYRPVLMKV